MILFLGRTDFSDQFMKAISRFGFESVICALIVQVPRHCLLVAFICKTYVNEKLPVTGVHFTWDTIQRITLRQHLLF